MPSNSLTWKHLRQTFVLSIPIVLGQLSIMGMQLTDTVMVAPLGADALAASAIANIIFITVCVFGMGILSILTPQIANAKVKLKYWRTNLLLTNALYLAIVLGVFSWLVNVLICYNFHWLAQPIEVERLAIPYLKVLSASALPLILFIAIRSFTDGLSLVMPGMIISLVGIGVNIILNLLFLNGYWGAPKMGIDGSALATLLTRWAMFLVLLGWIFFAKQTRPYIADFSIFRIRKGVIFKFLRLGMPIGAQSIFEVGAFTVSSVMIGWLGVAPLAAHEIGISMSSATYMVSFGFAIASSILVGGAYGNQKHEMRNYGNSALILVILWMGLAGLSFVLTPNFWVACFIKENDTQEVFKIASSLMILAGLYQLADGVQCVALGILRGMEDTKIPSVFSFVAYWVIGLPLGYVLAFWLKLGVQGVWIGLSCGLLLIAISLTLRFYWLVNKKMKIIDNTK